MKYRYTVTNLIYIGTFHSKRYWDFRRIQTATIDNPLIDSSNHIRQINTKLITKAKYINHVVDSVIYMTLKEQNK